MTVLKTAAVTVLAWVALGPLAEAAPMSWYGSSNVSAWYANQTLANGGFYAPPPASASVFASPSWYSSPGYFTSLLSTPQPVTQMMAPKAVAASPVDAFINMSSGSFSDAASLTTGNPQPWYNSPSVVAAFGGTPNSDQQASFVQNVLSDVQQTFRNSGLDISLTTDPAVRANHMLSVVSNASYPGNTGAIGITTVGGNGFSFIDKLAYASTPDQLAWAVAHNVSHELMHALGVGSHPDGTGEYLDAGTANWSMLVDPNARFSPQSVDLIQSALSNAGYNYGGLEGAQVLEAPVPEPGTIAIWSLSALGAMVVLRRTSRRTAA